MVSTKAARRAPSTTRIQNPFAMVLLHRRALTPPSHSVCGGGGGTPVSSPVVNHFMGLLNMVVSNVIHVVYLL